MSQPKYQHVLQAVYGRPLAIEEAFLTEVLLPIVDLRAAGLRWTEEEIEARLDAARSAGGQGDRRDGILAAAGQGWGAGGSSPWVIPVLGVISRRQGLMSASGGTSVEAVTAAFREAMSSDACSGVILAVDSPGGSVDGVDELAAEIRAARGQKPIVAVADAHAHSAAYWIASAAQELVCTPSGMVGSVGVIFAHRDLSKAAELAGEKTTLITAGRFKGEGHPSAPLTEEAAGHFQAQADEYYRMFTHAVARGRGVSMDTVRSSYGEGRSVMARDALAAGMVDRIDTLDNTIRRVARGAVPAAGLAPDTTGDAASASGPHHDPEAASAGVAEVVAAAARHAAARATEGRALSAADRERLEAARDLAGELLAASAAGPSGPRRSAAPPIDLAAEAVRRGYHIPQQA
jgi:signal peptide peptidase SppA